MNKKKIVLLITGVVVAIGAAISIFIGEYTHSTKQTVNIDTEKAKLATDLQTSNYDDATTVLDKMIVKTDIDKKEVNDYITKINAGVAKQQAEQEAKEKAEEAVAKQAQMLKEQQADNAFNTKIQVAIAAMNKQNSVSPFVQVLNSTDSSQLSSGVKAKYDGYVSAENAMDTVCAAERYLEAKDYASAQTLMNQLDPSTLISSGLLTQNVINNMNAQISKGLATQAKQQAKVQAQTQVNTSNNSNGVPGSTDPNNTSQYVSSLW